MAGGKHPDGEDGYGGNYVQRADVGYDPGDFRCVSHHDKGGECVRDHFTGLVDSGGEAAYVLRVVPHVVPPVKAKRERERCEQSDEDNHRRGFLSFRLSEQVGGPELARKAPVGRSRLPPQGWLV